MNEIERTYDRLLIKIKFIGLFQIIGGIIGLGMLTWLASIQREINLSLILLIAFIIFLYCYSILCGILLFRNPVPGLRLTFINQVLQVFQIALLGHAYKYLSGFGLVIGCDLTDKFVFSFDFEFSSFLMHFDTGNETRFLKFNTVAIFLSYYSIVLLERYQAIMKEREIIDIEDIGE